MYRLILLLAFFLLSFGLSFSQTMITVGPGSAPANASDCEELFIGSSVTLASSASCGLDIEIQLESGPVLTYTGEVVDTMKASPYVLSPDSRGVYTFTCLNNNKAVANQCYNVIPNPIPTVGEWGLIVLGLLFLIVSVVTIKQTNQFSSKKV